MEEKLERSWAHLAKAADRQKHHFDAGTNIRSFSVGEWVFPCENSSRGC